MAKLKSRICQICKGNGYVKIKKELNWKPKVNLDLGLKKTIIWYKKNISEFKI